MKKIGFISDLHINRLPISEETFIDIFSKYIAKKNISVLIIGGDISDNIETTIRFVEVVQNLSGLPVYFISGNHDYWMKGLENIDTWQIYEKMIQHPQCLMEKTLKVSDSVHIIGHSAWYNHAFANKKFNESDFISAKYNGRTWQDKLNTNWGMTDKKLSKIFKERIETQFEALDDKSTAILVTHMVTIKDYCVSMPHEVFDFFNAFIGTDDFIDVFDKYPITHAIMGHVHYRKSILKEDGITYVVNCLGYPSEWQTQDILKELEESMYILEIE